MAARKDADSPKRHDIEMSSEGVATRSSEDESVPSSKGCATFITVELFQKIIAELIGTYFLIFAGCGSVTLHLMKGVVTLPGIAFAWGFTVMVMVYSVGHVSGAHFNPAVTIAFASCGRFPWKQVPVYVIAQILAATFASETLVLLYGNKREQFPGTLPDGSDVQSFVIEIIITFYLMFVISAVATDSRAYGQMAGLAIGSTVVINILSTGPITGASMNPARTIGPAIVGNIYDSIWLYILGPIIGAVMGAWAYQLLRFTKKPIREIIKIDPFFRSTRHNPAS